MNDEGAMRNVRPLLPLLPLLLGASACGAVRALPARDSARVEVRTVTAFVKDTVYLELPLIRERVETLDTTSVLENDYAKSEASVSGGVLAHSLETKPVREPVAVDTRIVCRDSVVYRDRVVTRTVEVERKPSPWQALKMRAGGAALLIAFAMLLYILFNFFNPRRS